ncbi:MAG: LPS export ABC transporter periplasmic protein LptC [Bacteroidota bacterium]
MKIIQPKRIYFFGIKSIVVIFFTAMLFSCENRMETIRDLTTLDTVPAEIAKDVRIIFSDSAQIQMVLTSPLLYQIGGDKPYVEFPEGLSIKTYDQYDNLVTELTAEYGKRFELEKRMIAEKNVVVINHSSNKKLLTERLIWDEITKKIYNNVFVTIIESDKTFHGDSIRADQNFNVVELFNFRGTINIKDEDTVE